MTAYYNENNPFAAAWLRELIKANMVAQGDVDERSIKEISPKDLEKYTQCHFFAGIGVWSHALRSAGWPDDRPVWTGSCPCQPFSAAGKKGGFDDDRHLWPDWFRLIAECRPDTIFGEQVASKDGLNWFDLVSSDLEGAGYAVGAADLCAASVGAPHIRQRLYFVGHADDARPQGRRLGWNSTDKRIVGQTGVVGELATTADCRFLINHTGMPLARTLSGTLTLTEGPTALSFRATLDARQQMANDLAVSIERGDVSAMSCGFVVGRDKWSADYQKRVSHQVDMAPRDAYQLW